MKNSNPANSPSNYHHGDLRDAILEKALSTIEEVGLENLSLRDVARKLGVTTAAPYHHFQDRHALLVALATSAYTLLFRTLKEAIAGSQSPSHEIESATVAYLKFARDHGALYGVIFSRELVADHRQEGELKSASEGCFHITLACVSKVTGRTIQESSAAAFCVWSLLYGISQLHASGVLRESPAEQERLALEGVRGIVDRFRVKKSARLT